MKEDEDRQQKKLKRLKEEEDRLAAEAAKKATPLRPHT